MATHWTDRSSSLVHTTVAEAMRPGVVTCGPEQRLARVAATMAAHSIHTVVVPSVLGGDALTITDLDLIRHGLGGTLGETALDIARDPMATVAPSASLERATAMMANLDVAHLLVRDAESDLP